MASQPFVIPPLSPPPSIHPTPTMADEQGHYTKEINIPLPEKRHIAPLRIGIICTCWNQELLQPLISKTKAQLSKLGVEDRQIRSPIMVPGSFELPFAAQALAQ